MTGLAREKVLIGFACLYALFGFVLIPRAGIETDEAALSQADGYRRRDIRVIRDSDSRPQFELFMFDRVH
jgi:hypothetical protein